MAFSNYSDEELFQIIFKTTEEFYELIYRHEWLLEVFKVIDQKVITSQQTDFMVQVMGGPKKYGGRTPEDAHPHIYIDDEMWALREEILLIAFKNSKTPIDIQERWLKIDNAFKSKIVKTDVDQCTKRFNFDEIINVPNPNRKKVA